MKTIVYSVILQQMNDYVEMESFDPLFLEFPLVQLLLFSLFHQSHPDSLLYHFQLLPKKSQVKEKAVL